ncbi:MAG: YceI family protein [Chryseolinea sp.]
MLKVLLCCLITFCSVQLLAQKKFVTDKGRVDFVSNAELELIRSSSSKLRGVVNPASNQFAFSVPVQSFQGFNSELQREHFNEKYLESEKYSNMTFTGKIIEQVDFAIDGIYDVRAKGELNIHGEKQTRIIKSQITIDQGSLTIESTFKVPLTDHNISIPRIVNQKIATEIEVTVKAAMTLQ